MSTAKKITEAGTMTHISVCVSQRTSPRDLFESHNVTIERSSLVIELIY